MWSITSGLTRNDILDVLPGLPAEQYKLMKLNISSN